MLPYNDGIIYHTTVLRWAPFQCYCIIACSLTVLLYLGLLTYHATVLQQDYYTALVLWRDQHMQKYNFSTQPRFEQYLFTLKKLVNLLPFQVTNKKVINLTGEKNHNLPPKTQICN